MDFTATSEPSGSFSLLLFLFWILVFASALILILLVAVAIYNKATFRRCMSSASLEGKTVIVTGASAGIGKEAARDFARRKAKVILACRNLTKAQKVADDIKESTGNKNVHVKIVDTSVLSSVRAFAKHILEQEKRLDILVLNAGIGGRRERKVTEDALELTMATNHFGHFLLVNLLLELIEKSSPSRIVITSSIAHFFSKGLDPKDLNFEKEHFKGIRAYAHSKLCNVLMTKYLANYLQDKGVIVNSFCPGLVKTEIFEKLDTIGAMFTRAMAAVAPFVLRDAEEGAQTLVHLTVCKAVEEVSGAFFQDCKISKHSNLADDIGLVKKIWEKSEELVKLTPEERGIR